MGKKQKNKIYI